MSGKRWTLWPVSVELKSNSSLDRNSTSDRYRPQNLLVISNDFKHISYTWSNLFLSLSSSMMLGSQLKVTDYHVRCAVVSRYALTTVRSSVRNPLPVTKEAAFEVDLPASAFISNFTM